MRTLATEARVPAAKRRQFFRWLDDCATAYRLITRYEDPAGSAEIRSALDELWRAATRLSKLLINADDRTREALYRAYDRLLPFRYEAADDLLLLHDSNHLERLAAALDVALKRVPKATLQRRRGLAADSRRYLIQQLIRGYIRFSGGRERSSQRDRMTQELNRAAAWIQAAARLIEPNIVRVVPLAEIRATFAKLRDPKVEQ